LSCTARRAAYRRLAALPRQAPAQPVGGNVLLISEYRSQQQQQQQQRQQVK